MLGAGVEVVDRRHLEDQERKQASECAVRARVFACALGTRDRDLHVDRLDTGHDPVGSRTEAVEQEQTSVAAEDDEVAAERGTPRRDPVRARLDLDAADVLGLRGRGEHGRRTDRDVEVLGRILDNDGERRAAGDANEELDDVLGVQVVAGGRRQDEAARTDGRRVFGDGTGDRQVLGGRSDQYRHGAVDLIDDRLAELHPLARRQPTDLAGEPEANEPVAAGVDREARHPAHRGNVDRARRVERRRKRGEDAAPVQSLRHGA